MNRKIVLPDSEIPTSWYNIIPDLKNPPAPYYNPQTMKIIGPEDLAPLFPMELIKQEVSAEREIPIPEEVLAIYRLWRPTPLIRALNLEQKLGLKSKIYYKYEGASPAGSHKLNTAIAQAYYNKKEGIARIATETGAGQWGSAMSIACNYFGLKCTVYMVRVSYEQKPYRKHLMHVFNAEVFPSPTNRTNSGRSILKDNPNSPGSLGIAISEAVEDAATHADTHYSLGSVLNHVCMHQTVIGLEAKKQFAQTGDYPDVIVGCVGGGSNFAGITFPFIKEKMDGKKIRFVAVEPAACPTLTKGIYDFDYGDTAKMAPIALMYTLGHTFMPDGIHAGGLRYHGASALVSQLVKEGLVEAVALKQLETFQAAITFAQTEGIVPAPESAHAIAQAINEAKKADADGKPATVLFNLSGHGNFDMASYEMYFEGKLKDIELPQKDIDAAMKDRPHIK
ncbi:MAG: TrpB-like pyridoxal phosphate-dependent enzyme [Spirochaetes bacterium]|nr:TrpB-like pyridoxal phosphate-dependent enzyme [Spirochaetota bacterium]